MALAPIKVVLKSTTTQTLSDRFTEMVRHKSPGKNQRNREDTASLARASAKNRRLAEQMSRRKGGHAMMDQIQKDNVRDRIDKTKLKSNVRDRLGVPQRRGGGGDVQNRLGVVRGRGNSRRETNVTRGSSGRASFGGRGNFRGRTRGSVRGTPSRVSQTRGMNTQSSRGTGRGRGRPRGRPRGGRGRPKADKSNLDNELESYMTASKS